MAGHVDMLMPTTKLQFIGGRSLQRHSKLAFKRTFVPMVHIYLMIVDVYSIARLFSQGNLLYLYYLGVAAP